MGYLSLLLAYFLLVNLISFVLFGVDKKSAAAGSWRVPESNFFLLALIGGALGIYLGMRFFRHKTRIIKFSYGIPVLFLVNIAMVLVFIVKASHK